MDSATNKNFLTSICRSHIHESPQGLCISVTAVTYNFCHDQGKVSLGWLRFDITMSLSKACLQISFPKNLLNLYFSLVLHKYLLYLSESEDGRNGVLLNCFWVDVEKLVFTLGGL